MQAPRVGVIISIYKTPKTAAETIASALLQNNNTDFLICLINDGCPLQETEQALRSWATAHPGRINLIKTAHRGVSAARNTAIRVMMDAFPALEAFVFLEAEHRLDPDAASAFSLLLDNHPNVDWFYPQPEMDGIEAMMSAGGDYSLLRQSMVNACGAGSLVRRRVFEAGLSHDETMRTGYADWDFWLRAASRGFRGMPTQHPILRQRMRPDELPAGALLSTAEIEAHLRRKHGWLYSQRAIGLEHNEAPRYRVFITQGGSVLSCTDPLEPETAVPTDKLMKTFWHSVQDPETCGCGRLWIFTRHDHWHALKRAGLLRFVLWDLERRCGTGTMSFAYVEKSPREQFGYQDAIAPDHSPDTAALVALPYPLLKTLMDDTSQDVLASLPGAAPLIQTSGFAVQIPARFLSDATGVQAEGNALPRQSGPEPRSPATPLATLIDTITCMRALPYRYTQSSEGHRRKSWLPERTKAALWTRHALDCDVVYPSTGFFGEKPTVCFLLTTAEFGGVEAVAANVAMTLRNAGFRTAICMIGQRPITLIDGLEDAFDEVLWYPDNGLAGNNGNIYEGTHLPTPPSNETARELLGLLLALNVVIACNGGGAVAVFSALRARGVITAIYEHVMDQGPYGRSYGTPVAALAYEPALDYILTCSNGLGDWFADHGVAESKIIRIPNAAGYRLAEDRHRLIQPRRSAGGRPLRVLFLARYDRQKGLDRLADIVEAVQSAGLVVDWKVHGKSITDQAELDLVRLQKYITVSPPITSASGRTELYSWADILIVPSRFEGLPLTVLEAQRCGAVPLAARCGMIQEAIANEQDGLIVSQEDCVAEMINHIYRLDSDRVFLNRLSRTAMAKTTDWECRLGDFISTLQDRLDAKLPKNTMIQRLNTRPATDMDTMVRPQETLATYIASIPTQSGAIN
jgi:glycosyltransferase involved in cell wall biosynthesis